MKMRPEVEIVEMELAFLEIPNKYLSNEKLMGKFLERYADLLVEMNIAKYEGIISIETLYEIIVKRLGLDEMGYDKEFVATIFRRNKSKYDRQKTGAIEYKNKKGKSVLIDRVGLYLRQKRLMEKYFKDLIKTHGVELFSKAFEQVLLERSL